MMGIPDRDVAATASTCVFAWGGAWGSSRPDEGSGRWKERT